MAEITLEHIYHTFTGVHGKEITILSDINLQLSSGKIYLIYGPSGSGKTTLLQIMGTILKPTKGNVKIEDVNIYEAPSKMMAQFRISMGYLFQSPYIPFKITVFEYLMLIAELSRIGRKDAAESIHELLKTFEIDHLKKSKILLLSKGERQRIALISIFLSKIKYLFLDEPTGSLDFKNRDIIWNFIISYAKQHDVVTVIVSHDQELRNIADKSFPLKDGSIN